MAGQGQVVRRIAVGEYRGQAYRCIFTFPCRSDEEFEVPMLSHGVQRRVSQTS